APEVAPIVAAWVLIGGIVVVAAALASRAGRRAGPPVVGRLVESTAQTRAGSVVGLLSPGATAGASRELLALADARAAAVVAGAAPAVSRLLARGTRRSVATGVAVAGLGAALFVASAPAAGRAAAFWHPLRAIADARAPVRLFVDRATVRRGDSVRVVVEVPAATRAILWTRGPGEPWRPTSVTLDATGRVTQWLGPLEADLYLRAASGGRPGAERGAVLSVDGTRFSGRLAPTASGVWRLALTTADATPLEGESPELRLRVVPDSAPVVTVPIPGRDTTLPLSLRQPLVIDARDDHGLTRLEVVSWRVSQTGKVGAAVRETLDVSGAGERTIVQGDLDATQRGLLPGDTLR